jgi:hypothetical protein
MKRVTLLVATLGVVLGVLPVLAHHSVEAEFYQDREWTQTGVLVKVDWINPHSITWIEVKDASGKVERVGCQGHPPNAFTRAGLAKKEWIIGETVDMTCLAAKDGTKTWGFIKAIKYHKDGHVIIIRDSGV